MLHSLLGSTECITSTAPPGWLWSSDGSPPGLETATGATLRLDGLFDAFFESYWHRFTALRSVQLQGRIRGAMRLRIIRRRVEDGQERVLAGWQAQSGLAAQDFLLTVPLSNADAGESYLIVEVDAEPDAAIEALAWRAESRPQRDVKIGVAITTFNREPFVKANLTRLVGRIGQGRIIVVNHGAPGLSNRIGETGHADGSLRFIDQENSGGAGGFTRGMVEHRNASDITHVLLMDDDIALPADLVERMDAILAYADAPLCLGGAMFDYHDRRKLFTAGDYLVPGSFGIGHIAPPQGCDIGEPEGVDFLARLHTPDFNGWWCFAFPAAAMDDAGLPMPCFIRGDDVEYGYRLKQKGLPTIPWPGLAVWHMPFAAKSTPWHMFYDRRNSLFTNAIHCRIGRRKTIDKLLGGFIHHLLRYDYDRVRAMTMGIEAFNAGAGAMAKWTHLDHAALIAATTTDEHVLPGTTSEMLPLKTRKLIGARRSMVMARRLAADLFWPWRDRRPRLLAANEIWRPDLADRSAVVIETPPDDAPQRVYRYRWAATCGATVRCLRALTVLSWRFRARSSRAEIASWLPGYDVPAAPQGTAQLQY